MEIRGNFFQKKITDIFVFWSPKFDYKQIYDRKDRLIFIEKEPNNQKPNNYIPCMFYRNPNSTNFLICFHGNAEDIFTTENYGLDLRSYLNMNVIFVEYPGYSLYMDQKCASIKIFDDAIKVYDAIKKEFNILDKQIYILGRSLGTSPAIYLSSKRNPKALFLISAFKSMKNILEDKYISFVAEKIFNSINYIKEIECPIFFIHGYKDMLISFKHSLELIEITEKLGKHPLTDKYIGPNMTHDDFDLQNDIIYPIKNFLESNNLITNINTQINTNNNLFNAPLSIQRMIESKIFNIKDFNFSTSKRKFPIKPNANILIRLLDKRIALSHDLKITIFNDRYYTEDFEFDVKEDNISNSKINCLCESKNGNLICTTTNGDIFMYKIEEGEAIKNYSISLNDIIYKIDILNSGEVCLLSKNEIKIYDIYNEILVEKYSEKNSSNYINFIETDECLAFLSYTLLGFYQFDINEKKLKLVHHFKLDNQYNRVGTYNISKVYKSLIFANGNDIIFYDREKNQIKPIKSNPLNSLNENINYIHPIHDELFLASTSRGNILQIVLKENNDFKITEKTFMDKSINSLLLKDMKNIIITCENNVLVLNNTEKENCNIF